MSSSKILTIWWVAVCLEFATSAPAATEQATLIKTFDFPNANVSFDQRSYDEAKLVYGLCSGSDVEKNCQITQVSLDGTDKSVSCNVTLKASENETRIYHQVRVALLHKNRALVLWRKGQTLSMTNLDFDGCKTTIEAAVDVSEDEDDARGINVMAYEDTYDVFFSNLALCKKRTCRITMRNSGDLARENLRWGPEYEHPYKYVDVVSPVERRSSAKGFIVEIFEIYDKVYEVLVTDNGEKVLTTSKKVDDVHAISTIGGYIGICSFSWTDDESPGKIVYTLECKQMNYEGKLVKTELQANASSITGDDERKIDYMARLNQPEGFLLFTIEFDEDRPDEKSYRAYRIDANGQKVKSVEIADFQCAANEQTYPPRAFLNEAGQPCVSFVCDKKTWSYAGPFDRFVVGVRCFADGEI